MSVRVLPIAALLGCAGAACSLLVDTSGLSGGLAGPKDASSDSSDSPDSAVDADGSSVDGGSSDAGEAGTPEISFVQGASGQAVSGSAPVTLVLGKVVSVGDAILVVTNVDNDRNIVSVTDTIGNTYSQVAAGDVNFDQHSYLWQANPALGGVGQITVTASGATTWFWAFALEYSGLGSSGLVASERGSSTAADGMSPGPLPAASSGDLLFAFGFAGTTSGNGTVSAGTGMTERIRAGSGMVADRLFGAAGTVAATATMTTGTNWTMTALVFHPKAKN